MSGYVPRVLVVGAGLAGLATAFRLQTLGVQATVLEAQDEPGGRSRGDSLGGLEFDPIPWLTPSASPSLASLAQELGLGSALHRECLDGAQLLGTRRLRPLRLRTQGSLLPWRALATRRLRSLLDWFGPQLDALRPEHANRLDDRSVADFARLYLGSRVISEGYGPLLNGGFALDPEQTTRLLLLLFMNPLGDIALDRVQGLGALARELARRADVRTGARVEQVLADGRGVRLAGGERLEADAVVVATSATDALELTPGLCPAEERFLASCPYAPRIEVAVVVPARHAIGPRTTLVSPHRAGGLAAVWRTTPDPSDSDLCLFLLSARPDYARELWQDSDVNLCNTLLRRAEPAYPGLQAHVSSLRVHRLERAAPRFGIGHFRGVERLRREQLARFEKRRALLCGDYLVAPHPEGAVAAAERCARELTALLSDDSPQWESSTTVTPFPPS